LIGLVLDAEDNAVGLADLVSDLSAFLTSNQGSTSYALNDESLTILVGNLSELSFIDKTNLLLFELDLILFSALCL